MTVLRSGLAIVTICMLGACGLPAAPANMPPPLPTSASRPVSADPQSGIIEPVGEAVTASGAIGAAQTILTVPFGYRHTAVLVEDVTGFSITVSGTLAQAGAPGYYAGTFNSFGGGASTGGSREMWCFFRPVRDDGEIRDPLCLLRDDSGVAAIAPTRLSPFLWTSFSPMTGTFDFAHTPIFELREVEMPLELELDYRFDRWDDGIAVVEVYIRDKEVLTLRGRVRADEQQSILTIAGELLLKPVDGRSDAVQVSLVQ